MRQSVTAVVDCQFSIVVIIGVLHYFDFHLGDVLLGGVPALDKDHVAVDRRLHKLLQDRRGRREGGLS